MRPVRLQLKGFTSFKEETVVDFAHLDRFVVSGPTGAGKSSLFDAMTFALFCDAPRVDTGSKTDLVSLGKKSFAVCLDFRVGPEVYRVMRTRTRSGSAPDAPDQLFRSRHTPCAVPDGTRSVPTTELIATGAKQVTAAVERLLGLSYLHFTQAVFLPQGKFAEFLRAKASDRRKLLNDLLRLLIYEHMRESAGQEARSQAACREQTERRLHEDFADVGQASRDETARQLAEQRQIMAEADRVLPELRLRWDETRINYEWTTELEGKHLEKTRLEAKKPEMDALLAEVAAASRAAGVVPLLDQADQAQQAAVRRQDALTRANVQRDEKIKKHAAARTLFNRARKEAEQVPQFRERLQRLAEAVGKLALCHQLGQQIKVHEERQQALRTEQSQQAQALKQLAADCDALEKAVQQARSDVKSLGFDPDRQKRLQATIEEALRLRGDRERLVEALRQAEQAEARAAQAGQDAETASEQEASAAKAKKQAQRHCDAAEKLLRAAEDEHRALHLRAGLQAGKPCPVCRHAVSKLPKAEAEPELEESRQAFVQAQEKLALTDKALAVQSAAVATFQATLVTAEQQAKSTRTDAIQRQLAVQKLEKSLAESVGTLLPERSRQSPRAVGGRGTTTTVEPPAAIEDRILAAVRQATAESESYRQASQRVTELAGEHSLKQKDRQVHQAESARLERELVATAAKIFQDREALTRTDKEIQSATGSNEPAAESERLRLEIDGLEQRQTAATTAEGEANRLKLVAESEAETCAREASTASAKAKEIESQVAHALVQAGFADGAAARESFRAPAYLQSTKARIDEYSSTVQGLQSRINELEETLKGKSVSREECQQAERAHVECAERRNDAENKGLLLARQLEIMDERLTKFEQLRQELTVHQREQVIYDQLAKDLRSDYFQAYLLEETLASLVRDASAQLARLTGERYGLVFEDDRIIVIDYDNAAERRGIETLSGGETFLASLALALALSEQVQKIAGAVHLDCLFIDEGFGALDPETLRTVSDTIRALQVGGRMVGVITHVPEIKEEFDQRLNVEKKEGVSRVWVEVA